jgi:putative ubiquitin-RnfH superfamily antitoxin RatB of RatAB toxin-antitoxin module
MAEPPEIIEVEVAYARPDEQVILTVPLGAGACIQDAIEASGILARFPEIDLAQNAVGVFGKVKRLDTPLQTGDRVEIYRPLLADPKEVRRRLAAEGKVMGRGKASEQ